MTDLYGWLITIALAAVCLWLCGERNSQMNPNESKIVRQGLKRANKAVARLLFKRFGRRGLRVPFRARYCNEDDFTPWSIQIGAFGQECVEYEGGHPEAAVEKFRRCGMGLCAVRLLQKRAS